MKKRKVKSFVIYGLYALSIVMLLGGVYFVEKLAESEILKIFKHLAKDENKCVIVVTHSQNVCNEADTVYELGK